MLAILTPYLIKIGWSALLFLAQKLGAVSAIQADGIKIGTHILTAVENTKTDPVYPEQHDKFSSAG